MTTRFPYNPYDFANPVSDESLFVGRSSELVDIEYYLAQASAAPRATNIALLGPRAAGKTSLLNMIELRARRRGMCVARIDLNESDVENALGFFFKVFDAALSGVCDHERLASDGTRRLCFGGPGAKTYQTYLDMVSAYQVPEDSTFCSFLFPVQYAKAMAANAVNARVSDHNLRKDFSLVAKEAGVPIALLFDECNVLAKSRSLLEMLRNVFMNTPGYFLVFTGTPDLFPVMDEVFSPIVRQFKKVPVACLADRNETYECIAAPLRRIGLTDVVRDLKTVIVEDVERLTGKRPYEIQLLCHVMFRAMQRGTADHMALSVEVLDAVLAELSQGQDLSQRPILRALRTLSVSELKLAGRLFACAPSVTVEQFWFADYISGVEGALKAELLALVAKLKGIGLLDESEVFRFQGDDFDRIYSKYYAKKRGVDLSFQGVTFPFLLGLAIGSAVPRLLGFLLGRIGDEDSPSGEEVAAAISDPKLLVELFERHPRDAPGVYSLVLESVQASHKSLRVISCDVESPWSRHRFTFALMEEAEALDEGGPPLLEISARAKELGGSLAVSFYRVGLPAYDAFVSTLNTEASDGLCRRIAGRHFGQMTYAYLEGDRDAARRHGELGLAYSRSFDSSEVSNYAYVLLSCGEYDDARRVLGLISDQLEAQGGLPLFNLAVLDSVSGKYAQAKAQFERVRQVVAASPGGRCDCACLLVPRAGTSGVVLDEEMSPELGDAAQRARDAVESLMVSSSKPTDRREDVA